jgi:CxxC motif-containing protein (DUF1111 family)
MHLVFVDRRQFGRCLAGVLLFTLSCFAQFEFGGPRDPGVRGGAPGAGGSIGGLTVNQAAFFNVGQGKFGDVEDVPNNGLGPRFNLNQCSGCHAQPAPGGTSPFSNPQVNGNVAPPSQVNNLVNLGLIRGNGPIHEIRFPSDGGVHDLFTIVGLSGAPSGCQIQQPNFQQHLQQRDLIFRIPTPVFGAGLIEGISDASILANQNATKPFNIRGHVNTNGNDGTITRFGWKAQNKSLLLFSGEAYNVEMGISNELFQQERGEAGIPDPEVCDTIADPNDTTNFESTTPTGVPSDIINFANFMRFLDQPKPACQVNVNCSWSINNGFAQFRRIGCAVCHTPSMQSDTSPIAALNNISVNLFSDLLVHNMGQLGDGVTQGAAGPNEFRTAPLWGLGQRIFFLHDGRTTDLLEAIQLHDNFGQDFTSEAEDVIENFNRLFPGQKQDILNFLRSL